MLPAIDIHTHFVPQTLAAEPAAATRDWPSMAPGPSCCHRNVMINGANFRTVTDQCWSAEKRIADMPAMGISKQVLSPMPELLSYWMPAGIARILLRDINEQMATVVRDHPRHFAGFCAVPMQDIDLAVEELEYARSIGLCGVEIGSNINGRPIGAPEFDPFFAAATRLGMAVFVHAVRPQGERFIGPAALKAVVGFPVESGNAALSAITTNLVVRYPDLRIAFSHGGGTLAAQLGRFHHCWQSMPALQEAMMGIAPLDQARLLYYDTCVFSVPTVRFVMEMLGTDRLMLGSDYPFARMETEPVKALEAATDDPQIREKVRYSNALAFLTPKHPAPESN